MVLYIYAGTLFLSAFILFMVQPIIGKMILPKLGGTPQVWNTCMVFFQMVLLAGYAYTHSATTRLNPRRQLLVHAVLLFLPLLVLFAIPYLRYPFDVEWWYAPPGSNPIPMTLLALVIIVGLPFFVVSTSAPLLQRWFVYTGHPAGKDPYFLYGASNLGSLLGLVLYPLFFEHYFNRDQQAWLWAGMYIAFIGFVLISAYLVWEPTGRYALAYASHPAPEPQTATKPEVKQAGEGGTAISASAPAAAAKETGIKKGPTTQAVRQVGIEGILNRDLETISPYRRFRWIALAAVPSSFMLGVTTHMTTDLSPIPLFWVIPLSLYLISFILVFSKWPWNWVEKPHTYMLYAQPAALALMLFVDWRSAGVDWKIIAFFLAMGFFFTAMVCHGELARDRPSTKHLTEFYLMMSVGGMIGGMFNGLIAPIVPIPYVWEFSLAIIAGCLFRPPMKESGWADDLMAGAIEQQPGVAAPAPAKGGKGTKGTPKPVSSGPRATATPKLARLMDFILPAALMMLVFLLSLIFAPTVFSPAEISPIKRELYAFLLLGVPLIIACFFYGRPLRFGVAVAGIIIAHGLLAGDSYIHGDRSYYGIIRVRAQKGITFIMPDETGSNHTEVPTYNSLMHGNIDHGMNFRKPGVGEKLFTKEEYENKELLDRRSWGKRHLDFSRIASTYYHRYGPAGVIMERWNWSETSVIYEKDSAGNYIFVKDSTGNPILEITDKGKFEPKKKIKSQSNTYWKWGQNTWHADARMPGTLMGLALADGLGGALQGASTLCHAWSEPPIATIGLGTGTMASYARPYMSCHFYEIDNHIKKLSLPDNPKGKVYFTYLLDAIDRTGDVGDVQVYLGDAYQRMKQPYYNIHDKEERKKHEQPPGGPDNFYKMMVVDAFSSDAIPVHLLTKEAFKIYFEKLTEDGILCVHTSNRYVDLPKVVADVAESMGFVARRGHDVSPFKKGEGRTEHYTSEWVMVAKKAEYLDPFINGKDPVVNGRTYKAAMDDLNRERDKQGHRRSRTEYWRIPRTTGRYIWTLDHSNLFNVLRGRGDDTED